MKKNIGRARKLRRTMSPPEAALWQILRTRPGGFKYRRQHPVDPYTLDFFCHEAALAIEVDGDAHDLGDNPTRDFQRDAWLEARGGRTIRFLAADVMKHTEAVIRQIVEECAPPPPSGWSPSPAKAGED